MKGEITLAIDQIKINSTAYDIGASASNISFNKSGTSLDATNVQSAIVEIDGDVSALGNNKVDKVNGKGLSTNDFTDAAQTKLSGIETGAQVNTITGVKGSAEQDYRIGNVSISKADIGLANVDNTSDVNKPISTATQNALNNKVDKVTGKGLSTNDYTTAEKDKLDTVSEYANHVNVTRYGTEGTKIATISCDGIDTDIYNGGSGPSNAMIKGVDYVTAGKASGSTLGTKATAEGNEVIPSGDYSHAEGSFTSAMGDYSHAEGRYTFAGNYAHSEGQFSSGAGSYSHAEGQYTFAGGSSAHAEGDRTSALGSYSHAEGNGTSAASVADHAEGQETSAYNYSHAEGNNTYAYGNSHAEGLTTMAGSYSHAEGSSTCAVGESSHAEGNYTVARNPYAHAEGQGTSAFGESSHAEGYHTYTNGTQGNHAEGVNSSATGFISHAEGRGTLASGNQSHAEGNGTTAHTNSHAEGSYTYANNYSHAEGGNTNAIGDYSHAEGYYTTASEDYSHASGYKTCASGIGAHAEGGYTTASVTVTNVASGINSHAEGGSYEGGQFYSTYAIGESSHAEGIKTTAYSNSSHAEGYKTYASGHESHAEGDRTHALGVGGNGANHSEGSQTTAYGDCSHAEGEKTYSVGLSSHAEGLKTSSIGQTSHAEGGITTAYGNFSHSEGAYTIANDKGTHAEGFHTCAIGEYQHVEGKYNIADSTMAHIIGNGTSTTRSNAFTVSWDGDVTAGRSNGLTNDNKLPTGADVKAYVDAHSLPDVTTSDNGKVLSVVEGVWDKADGNQFFVVTSTDNKPSNMPVTIINKVQDGKNVLFKDSDGKIYNYSGYTTEEVDVGADFPFRYHTIWFVHVSIDSGTTPKLYIATIKDKNYSQGNVSITSKTITTT